MFQSMLEFVEVCINDAEDRDLVKSNAIKLKKLGVVPWAIEVFAKLPVVRQSNGEVNIAATFSKKQEWEFKHGAFGHIDTFNSVNIGSVVRLFNILDWSNVSAETQTKAQINSAVPLVLYAQKRNNGIPYSAWYKDIRAGRGSAVLGKRFSEMDFNPVQKYELGDLLKLRELMYTGSKGEKFPLNLYKKNNTGEADFDILDKTLKLMLTQSWIFNAAYRNPNMILDWENWDNIPEPIDKVLSYRAYNVSRVNDEDSDLTI